MKWTRFLGVWAGLLVVGLGVTYLVAGRGTTVPRAGRWHLDPMAPTPPPQSTRFGVLVSFADCTQDSPPTVSYGQNTVRVRFTGDAVRYCTNEGADTIRERTVELREPL